MTPVRLVAAGGAALAALAFFVAGASAKPAGGYLASDRALVNHYAAVEGAKLGISLPGGPNKFIKLVESPQQALDEKVQPDGTIVSAAAETGCYNAQGTFTGRVAGCEITVAKSAHADGEINDALAHEVFHVYQALMTPNLDVYNRPGAAWLFEGSAEWVGSTLAPGPAASERWAEYLRTPHKPLFSRDYDAVGFYGHLASSGISPWSRFKAMFATESNEAAYAASGAGAALNSEASAFFREPALGSAWNQTGPSVPSPAYVGYQPPSESVTDEEDLLDVAPYTDAPYRLSLKHMTASKPVLEVRVVGAHARLRATGGGSVNQVVSGHVDLCALAKGCQCPSKPSATLPRFSQGNLAIAGGASGGDVWLVPRPRCETLLSGRKCQQLLPQLNVPVAATLEGVVRQPLSNETSNPSGYYSSYCIFPGAKGETIDNANGESVFDGIGAFDTYVTRYPTEGQAERAFAAPPVVSGLTGPVSVPGIGDQASIVYGTEDKEGESLYVAIAVVRVDNVIAGFSIFSSGGNDEANLPSAEEFLREIAESL